MHISADGRYVTNNDIHHWLVKMMDCVIAVTLSHERVHFKPLFSFCRLFGPFREKELRISQWVRRVCCFFLIR